MNAAMPREMALELARRVAVVRESTGMAELEDAVEQLGECQRHDTARWVLESGGARTVARDLVRTETEREVCDSCPVRDRCLALAVLTGDVGGSIHGGLLPQQQRSVARALEGLERQDAVLLGLPSRVVLASVASYEALPVA